jgi:hypothetical protein
MPAVGLLGMLHAVGLLGMLPVMMFFTYWAPALCQWWGFLYTEHLPYANDETFYILSTCLMPMMRLFIYWALALCQWRGLSYLYYYYSTVLYYYYYTTTTYYYYTLLYYYYTTTTLLYYYSAPTTLTTLLLHYSTTLTTAVLYYYTTLLLVHYYSTLTLTLPSPFFSVMISLCSKFMVTWWSTCFWGLISSRGAYHDPSSDLGRNPMYQHLRETHRLALGRWMVWTCGTIRTYKFWLYNDGLCELDLWNFWIMDYNDGLYHVGVFVDVYLYIYGG